MKNYPKGSYGADEQKNRKTWAIVVSVVTVSLLLIFFVLNTYPHEFIKRASTIANVSGFLLVLAGGAILAFCGQIADYFNWNNDKAVGVGGVILLAFALCLCCGFNFDLHNVKEIK